MAQLLARRPGALVPPAELLERTSSPTPADFRAAGPLILTCCRLGGLRPSDRFLDIGCGVGRAAVPLTGVLVAPGSYTGVDVWPAGVAWCTSAIAARHPHFTFVPLDLHHRELNPAATTPITAARLPFDDAVFDFALLGAINHLTAAELRALVAEAGRVLCPGGTYVGTWFLADDPTDPALPPAAVGLACTEAEMEGALAAGGLRLRALHQGGWRARESLLHQDLVIAEKTVTTDSSADGPTAAGRGQHGGGRR